MAELDLAEDILAGVASEVKGDTDASPTKTRRKGGGKGKSREDKFHQLTLLMAQAQLGIFQRLRSLEAVSFEFFEVPASMVISVATKACGAKIAEKRKALRTQGKNFKLSYPIHVVVWEAALQEFRKNMTDDNPHKQFLADYLENAKLPNQRYTMANEISYFRRLDCYDKSNNKFIVNCAGEGTKTHEIWTIMLNFFLSPACGGKRLQGVAPRNGKERKIARMVDELNGKKNSELVARMSVDGEEEDLWDI